MTICVDTASYHQVTCVVCKHDRKCRSCEYWYVIHVLLLLFIYFNQIWCMSGYSSESNYKSKVKEKASGFPRMIGVSFIGKMHKLVYIRNRCVSVWIMLLSYIIIERTFFLFSGFDRILHCLRLSTDVYWINSGAYKLFYFRVPSSLRSQAAGRNRGWPWLPSRSFDGGVAG